MNLIEERPQFLRVPLEPKSQRISAFWCVSEHCLHNNSLNDSPNPFRNPTLSPTPTTALATVSILRDCPFHDQKPTGK
jgi:hypothetical protein